MNISVIIPVYNAAPFVTKAVESAVQFKEVKEVILVEDGSSDNSLIVCEQLSEKYNVVKLFQHPNGENRGAGASRNLALKMASNEYIAFLDADDYWLSNRFDYEIKRFKENDNFEGCYGALGFDYMNKSKSNSTLTTVNKVITPNELVYVLLELNRGIKGYFSIVTLTCKREVVVRLGGFDETMRLHQDTDLIFKVAYVSKLESGIIDKPIGMRGVHGNNRITSADNNFFSNQILFANLLKWFKLNSDDQIIFRALEVKLKFCEYMQKDNTSFFSLVFFIFKNPDILQFDRILNKMIRKSLSNPRIAKALIKIKEKLFIKLGLSKTKILNY